MILALTVRKCLALLAVVRFTEGFFCCVFDVLVVSLVEVFAFGLTFEVVVDFFLFDCVPVICWFFFSAVCVFDFSDDDLLAVRDVPVERVAFFQLR